MPPLLYTDIELLIELNQQQQQVSHAEGFPFFKVLIQLLTYVCVTPLPGDTTPVSFHTVSEVFTAQSLHRNKVSDAQGLPIIFQVVNDLVSLT